MPTTPSDIIATAARLGCRPWRGPTDGEAFQAWADRVEWARCCEGEAYVGNVHWRLRCAAAIVEADRQAGYGPRYTAHVEGHQP